MHGIRLYQRRNGTLEDLSEEYDLEDFGGVVPSIGDHIVDPGANRATISREDPSNRTILKVVDRFFWPRDNKGYVALVIEQAPATDEHVNLL